MRKSQSAIEFISLATFMLLVILGFFAITSSKILESKEEGNREIAADIADFAYREIEIAKSVNDGYTRVFSMPRTVNGVNYSIKITDNRELAVDYLGYEHVRFLPSNVTGNLTKGTNMISKANGVIFINGSQIEISPFLTILLMKNNNINAIGFDNSGNVILRGGLQQNIANPQITGDDEFIFRDSNGNNVAVINLVNGNMFIKGSLQENQASLTPSAFSSDFIVKAQNGNVIAYFDESGNLYLKGTLTQNGNP